MCHHVLCFQVLRVLGNVAYNGPEYCIQLMQAGLLSALCATLKMADPDVITLSLEVLHLLTASSPQVRDTGGIYAVYKLLFVLQLRLFRAKF